MRNHFNTIAVELIGDAAVLDVRGDVIAASEPYFSEAFLKTGPLKAGRIVLKLEPAAHIDSGGIFVLIQILQQARQDGRPAAIAGFSEHYRKIFRMVGISRLATLCDSLEVALRDLKPGARAG